MAVFAVGLMFLWSAWAVLGALLSFLRVADDDLVVRNSPGTTVRVRLASVAHVVPEQAGLRITMVDGWSFRARAVRDIGPRSSGPTTRAARIAWEIGSLAAGAAGARPGVERPPGLSTAWLVEPLRPADSDPGNALLIRPRPGERAVMASTLTVVALFCWLLLARLIRSGGSLLPWQVLTGVAALCFTVGAAVGWSRVSVSEAWLLRADRFEIGVLRTRDRSWSCPPATVTGLELVDKGGYEEEQFALVAVTRSGQGGRRGWHTLEAKDPVHLGTWLARRTGLPLTTKDGQRAEPPVVPRRLPHPPPGWLAEPLAPEHDTEAAGLLLRPPRVTKPRDALGPTALAAFFWAITAVALYDGEIPPESLFPIMSALFAIVMSNVAVSSWRNVGRSPAWRLRPRRLEVGTIRARDRNWVKPPSVVTALEVVRAPTASAQARLVALTATGDRDVLWWDGDDAGSSLRIGEWLACRTGLPLDRPDGDGAPADAATH